MSASQSSSSTRTATSTQTTLDTRNENVSGNQGLTAAATGGSHLDLSYAPVTINTDAGAVAGGVSVANAGISAVASTAALAVDAAGKSNDVIRSLAADAVARTTDFSAGVTNRAFDIVEATTASNATNAREYAEGVVNFAGGVLTQFGTQLADYEQRAQAQLGNTVSALNQSYVENNRSADQQVISAVSEAGAASADLIREVFKYAAIAAGVAALAFLVVRGKKVLA